MDLTVLLCCIQFIIELSNRDEPFWLIDVYSSARYAKDSLDQDSGGQAPSESYHLLVFPTPSVASPMGSKIPPFLAFVFNVFARHSDTDMNCLCCVVDYFNGAHLDSLEC